MGQIVEALTHKCVICKRVSIPLSISGVYLAGGQVILHECSHCGHVRKHGIRPPTVKRGKKPKSFPFGRLSQLIVNASRRS